MSALTSAQLQTLKAAIAADGTLNTLPHTDDNAFTVATAFNLPDPGPFVLWKSTTLVSDIFNAINWANLTPQDVPDGTAIYTNRALICQTKQMNLQLALQGQQTVNSGLANIRGLFSDALSNIPSGASGASKNGGTAAVNTTMQRNATRAEKLFATGTGTSGSPATIGWEGILTYTDVDNAWNS